MTWKGFFVKNKDGNGYVEISSINDIAVFKNGMTEPKIKIGRLKTIKYDEENEETIYGIR